jgi:hypothetical protein
MPAPCKSSLQLILSKKRWGKSAIKRDGPVFFFSAPVKVAGDEKKIMAIVAPMSRRSPCRTEARAKVDRRRRICGQPSLF